MTFTIFALGDSIGPHCFGLNPMLRIDAVGVLLPSGDALSSALASEASSKASLVWVSLVVSCFGGGSASVLVDWATSSVRAELNAT